MKFNVYLNFKILWGLKSVAKKFNFTMQELAQKIKTILVPKFLKSCKLLIINRFI